MEINLKKMKRFTDIKEEYTTGECCGRYTCGCRPDLNPGNPICRTYNNLWGMITDTHMSQHNDMYIITGSYFEYPHAAINLLYSSSYNNVQLGNTIAFPDDNFGYFMAKNGYEGHDTIWNGSKAFMFTRIQKHRLTSDPIAEITSESNKYPRQIDLSELKESENIVTAINESKNIAGKNWMYAELDGCKYLFSCNENDTVKINLGSVVENNTSKECVRYTIRLNEYNRNNYCKRIVVEDAVLGHQYYGFITESGKIENINENQKKLDKLNEIINHIENFNPIELKNGLYKAVGESLYDENCMYKIK